MNGASRRRHRCLDPREPLLLGPVGATANEPSESIGDTRPGERILHGCTRLASLDDDELRNNGASRDLGTTF